MRTVIELFDEEPLKNICSQILYPGSKMVLIGGRNVFSKRRIRGIKNFLVLRGIDTEPEYIKTEDDDAESFYRALERVITREPECLIDLTGGSDYALFAAGALAERYKISVFRINPRNGKIISILGELPSIDEIAPLTVRQIVALYGGSIINSDDEDMPINDELRDQVDILCKLCAADNTFLNRISAFFNRLRDDTYGLCVSAKISISYLIRANLKKLNNAGFIENYIYDGEKLSFVYRNETAKQLLTKAGLTLETAVRLAATDAEVFDDVRQGITLDWDGVEAENYNSETRNEIDVAMTRGITPVFVSCKNGNVKKEALYELETVAEKFGGMYVKKVLVCSALTGTKDSVASFRSRASDMGIKLIENAYLLSPDELIEEIEKIK